MMPADRPSNVVKGLAVAPFYLGTQSLAPSNSIMSRFTFLAALFLAMASVDAFTGTFRGDCFSSSRLGHSPPLRSQQLLASCRDQ